MLLVRRQTDADIAAVAALHVRAWRAGYAGILPADVLDALDEAEFAARKRRTGRPAGADSLVTVDDGTITGFIAFGPHRRQQGGNDFDPSIGEIYAVYVDPDRWRHGAGRALLGAAFDAVSGLGVAEVRLWVLEANDRARRFYERCGMAPDGERAFYQVRRPNGETVELPEVRYAARLR